MKEDKSELNWIFVKLLQVQFLDTKKFILIQQICEVGVAYHQAPFGSLHLKLILGIVFQKRDSTTNKLPIIWFNTICLFGYSLNHFPWMKFHIQMECFGVPGRSMVGWALAHPKRSLSQQLRLIPPIQGGGHTTTTHGAPPLPDRLLPLFPLRSTLPRFLRRRQCILPR